MTTRPTDDPAPWTASGNTSAPASGQVTQGWDPFQKPPAQEVNFQWASWAAWLAHLSGTAAKFTALEDVNGTSMVAGDTFILDETATDNSLRPGVQQAGGAAASARDVDVSGFEVFTTNADTHLRIYNRALGVVRADVALAGAGTPVRVLSDGIKAWVAHGQLLEQFDVTPGAEAQDWSYDHGGAINDIAHDNGRIYLVGAAGTGGHQVRAISSTTGLAVWSAIHGATLQSVCCDGYRTFIGGGTSALGSGANLRAVMSSNGEDATGEMIGGGNTEAWDIVLASVIANSKAMVCDDMRLYVARTAGNELTVRNKPNGVAVLTDTTLTAVSLLAIDHEYVYALTSTTVTALTKTDLVKAWTSSITGGAPVGIASDGAKFFAARTAGNDVIPLIRGNKPGLWQLVANADYRLPRQRVIPAVRH